MLETGSRLHNFKHTSMSNQKCIKIPETDSQRHARDTGGMSRKVAGGTGRKAGDALGQDRRSGSAGRAARAEKAGA